MAPHMRAVAIQGIQKPDRVDLSHALRHFFGREPGNRGRLIRRALNAAGRLATEDQGDDPPSRVLVDAGQFVHLNLDTRLLQDLAHGTCLRGLVEFEYAAGKLPSAVVRPADRQEAAIFAHHYSGHRNGVQRRRRCFL